MFQNTTPKAPRSHREARQAPFLNQKGRPPYYEDIYRSRDPGEDDEGSAEQCESESGSDVPVRTGSTKVRRDQSFGDNGRKKELAKVNIKGSKGRAISISSGSEESGEEEDVLSSSKSVDKSPPNLNEDHQYQIAPILNPKHSLPKAEVRRLKARKCGLFSGAFGISIKALRAVEYNEGVADDEQSEVAVEDVFGGRAKRESVKQRSARRTSIKQQLAERVAARKQAQKAEKKALREKAGRKAAVGTKKSSKTASKARSKPKMRTSIGSKSSKPAAQQHDGALRAAVVMVDNRGIDFAEYQRYDSD